MTLTDYLAPALQITGIAAGLAIVGAFVWYAMILPPRNPLAPTPLPGRDDRIVFWLLGATLSAFVVVLATSLFAMELGYD